MKKLFIVLFSSIIVFSAYAQIGEIKSTPDTTMKSIGKHIILDKNTYHLIITSSNSYDSDIVELNIGTTPEAAVTSLKNLRKAIEKPNTKFSMQGYNFKVDELGYADITSPKYIRNAAGVYTLYKDLIGEAIRALILEYKLHLDTAYTVTIFSTDHLVLTLELADSHYSRNVLFYIPSGTNVKVSDVIQGNTGDVLKEEQIRNVVEYVQKGTFRMTENVQFFMEIVNKNIDAEK